MQWLARGMTRAWQPVDGGSCAAFRILFGLVGLAGVIRFCVRGWISELYIQPEYHFAYLGFAWLKPWPQWGMYAHFGALGALCVLIAVGLGYRISIMLFFVGFTYVELLDQALYLNHYYGLSLISLLMIFMPLHRVASMDARRKPALRSRTLPAWVLWTLRTQLALIYLFAGLAKLNADWLLRALPLRIWLYAYGDWPLAGPWLRDGWLAYALSWGGAFFDLTIAGWLLWPRTRFVAYAALLGFHLATWILFPAIGMFPWHMMSGALIFLAPDWPRRARAWLGLRLPARGTPLLRGRRRPPARPAPAAISARGPRWTQAAAAAGLALFAAAQAALPLRHWLYPGNVQWNEEGYYFSWRVMLTEKAGFVEFKVHAPATGQRWLVQPDAYLTAWQIERMATQPDMIRQTAHFIAADYTARGHGVVEVRADAFVSFNGRPHRRLVDPDVDLAAQPPGRAPRAWVRS